MRVAFCHSVLPGRTGLLLFDWDETTGELLFSQFVFILFSELEEV